MLGLTAPSGGVYGDAGEALRAGATLAVDRLNRGGGIHDVPMRVKIEDSGSDPRTQVQAFSSLTDAEDIPVVVTGGEDDYEMVRALARVRQVLVLNAATALDSTRKAGLLIKIGRSYAGANEALVSFIKDRKITRLAVIAGSSPWARTTLEHLRLSAPPGAFSIVAQAAVPEEATSVPSDFAMRIMRARPELVYVIGTIRDQRVIAGLMKSVSTPPDLIHSFACDHDGGVSVMDYPGTHYSVDTSTKEASDERAAVEQAFRERYPKLPFSIDAAVAYDAVMMVAEAYKSGAGLAEAVYNHVVNQKMYKGVAGKIEFTQGGDSIRPAAISRITATGCKLLSVR